jgi:hypothetical protein
VETADAVVVMLSDAVAELLPDAGTRWADARAAAMACGRGGILERGLRGGSSASRMSVGIAVVFAHFVVRQAWVEADVVTAQAGLA